MAEKTKDRELAAPCPLIFLTAMAMDHSEKAQGVPQGIDLAFFVAVDGRDGNRIHEDAPVRDMQEYFRFGRIAFGDR